MRKALVWLGLALTGWVPAAQAAPGNCAARLLPGSSGRGGEVTARSLVELRDFGRVDSGLEGEAPFSVSPDGRWAALVLRRADADADSYCTGVMLVPLAGQSGPRLLDVGGAFIASANDIRGAPDVVNGSPRAVTPLWSPGGRRLAYFRRDDGVTQIWSVGLDGLPARQLTDYSTDATDFAWIDDRTLRVGSRPVLLAGAAAIEREGRSGFLYDQRFWTVSEPRPRPPIPQTSERRMIDAESGDERTSPAVKNPAPGPIDAGGDPAGAVQFVHDDSGLSAWTAEDDPGQYIAPVRLHVSLAGKGIDCPEAICARRVGGLWLRGAGELLILRAGGPDEGGRESLYRWKPATEAAPTLVLETADALMGCRLVGRALICARESALQPRTLARIDTDSGRIATIFDPNPEYTALRKGTVERLTWTDLQGIRSYGDLVLPPDHRAGQRHPLIVVQYQSRGFLRGGTGDEYPIQLFAAQGYAVLSFQRPASLPAAAGARDGDAMQRVSIAGWAERRVIVASLEAGVDAAIARGAVDPSRIGLTGLSDGAATVQFVLANSSRFKAAAISTCCDDPTADMVNAGLAYRDALLRWGYPAPESRDDSFWRPMSLTARPLMTPMLLQLPDAEFRLALGTYSTLQYRGAPIEMYVFPDEHHVKWHPAHRLAIYRRNLAWFDFWLMGKNAADPDRAAELARWESFRQTLAAPRMVSVPPPTP
ncbi:MAG: Atxe2 family lasso peptide isopeptidase [Sphingomonas bacterium]